MFTVDNFASWTANWFSDWFIPVAPSPSWWCPCSSSLASSCCTSGASTTGPKKGDHAFTNPSENEPTRIETYHWENVWSRGPRVARHGNIFRQLLRQKMSSCLLCCKDIAYSSPLTLNFLNRDICFLVIIQLNKERLLKDFRRTMGGRCWGIKPTILHTERAQSS